MNEINTQIQIGIKGAYAYQVIDDVTGDIVVDVPEQTNLILDSYLDIPRPLPNQTTFLCLGSGVVTPPSVTDTDLGNQVAGTYMGGWSVGTYQDSTDNFLISLRSTTDFTNIINNEISELGVRLNNSTGTLITRALIKDTNGNPASISVGEGQTLRFTYSLYFKIPKAIFSGSVSTPHGIIEYEYSIGDQVVTQSLIEAFVRYSEYGGSNQGQAYAVYFSNGSSAGSYGSKSLDIPNRKVISTFNVPAATSDRILGAPASTGWTDRLLFKMARYNDPFHFRVPKNATRLTLPANYDLTVQLEITWGRLP